MLIKFGIIVIVFSIMYTYYKFIFIYNFWRRRGIFYVKPVMSKGNVLNIVTRKAQIGFFFHDAYMKYKHHQIFGMFMLFKPILVIADLDLIRIILTKKFESFQDHGIHFNRKINPLLDNLFTYEGERWRNIRIKMTSIFTTAKIKQMFPIMKNYSEKLAKNITYEQQLNNSVDIKDLFERYSTDVIMSTVFGVQSNSIGDPNDVYRSQGKKLYKINILRFILYICIPCIMNFFSIPFLDKNITNFFMNMFRQNVKYRKTHNIIRHDFVNLLIQLIDKEKKFTMTDAVAQSYLFFIAGFESSSTTATFVLYELAQHQNVQDKVCKEINEILAKYEDLSYEAINEMTYLHKIIQETMRKYPPLPILTRVCTKEIDLPIANVRVPKGSFIFIPVLGLHRDPLIYPDPEKFDPERFNADEVAKRHSYAYLPFGEGPRTCIGSRFGYMQLKVALVCLLSKYRFKPHSKTKVPIAFNERSFGLAIKGGVHLLVQSREVVHG